MKLKISSKGIELKKVNFVVNKISYFNSFDITCDFVILFCSVWGDLNAGLGKDAELTLEMTSTTGDIRTFNGVVYFINQVHNREVQVYIVSKYYKNLMSTIPTYGKGDSYDVIKSLYNKAGIRKIIGNRVGSTFESIAFPVDMNVDDSISYVLNRSVSGNNYVVSTVIRDEAIVAKIGTPENIIDNLNYDLINVIDKRKAIDINGGLKTEVVSNAKDSKDKVIKLKGLNEVDTTKYYSTPNSSMNFNKAKNEQLKVYYSNYVIEILTKGWENDLIGRYIKITNKNVNNPTFANTLDVLNGIYFISTQVIYAAMGSALEDKYCRAYLIKELEVKV